MIARKPGIKEHTACVLTKAKGEERIVPHPELVKSYTAELVSKPLDTNRSLMIGPISRAEACKVEKIGILYSKLPFKPFLAAAWPSVDKFRMTGTPWRVTLLSMLV